MKGEKTCLLRFSVSWTKKHLLGFGRSF